MSKRYISTSSSYPPDPEPKRCIFAINVKHSEAQYADISEIEKQYIQDKKLTVKSDKHDNNTNVIAVIDFNIPDSSVKADRSVCVMDTQDTQMIQMIPDSNDKWWIDVPICNSKSKIIWIQMLADPGANIGCVNTKFAMDNFPNSIVHNNKRGAIATPNGHVIPKYALWLKFPTKKGYIYAARFLLLNELPAPILADINMLRAWGYKFDDGIPPVFIHEAQESEAHMQELDTKMEDKYNINKPVMNYVQCRNLDSDTNVAATIFTKYTQAKFI